MLSKIVSLNLQNETAAITDFALTVTNYVLQVKKEAEVIAEIACINENCVSVCSKMRLILLQILLLSLKIPF